MCTLKFAVLFGILVAGNCEHFEFGDRHGEPCILMDIDAEFNLTYTYNDTNTEIAPEFNLDGAEVVNQSSICGDSEFDSVLTLRIFPTEEYVKFRIGPKATSENLAMSLTLSVHPGSHFEGLNDSLPFEMKDSKNLPAGLYSNDSYVCRSEQRMTFDLNPPYSMTVTIKNLQVQAFQVQDARYGPVMECPLDPTPDPYTTPSEISTIEPENITTVAPDTTLTTEPRSETTMTTQPHSETTMTTQPHSETTMTTQPHSETTMTTKPPITTQPLKLRKFVLRNGSQVCVVLQGKLSFEIPYLKKGGKSATAMVNIPSDTMVSGNCSYNNTNNEQEVKLSFNDGWELTVIIVKDGKTSGLLMSDDKDNNDYSWQKVILTYVIDDNFPDALNPGQNSTVVQVDTFGQFKSTIGGSYKCVAKQQITLPTKIKIDLSDFQYRAFGTSTTDVFSSNDVSECAADDDNDTNNKTLAIILGAGFGGLAVLIILAGVILRCKRKRQQKYGYDEI